MIDVLVKFSIRDNVVTMSGRIDPEKRKIELNCQTRDFPQAITDGQSLFHSIFETATFIGTDSKPYSAYGMRFYSSQVSLMDNGIMTLHGSFRRLVKEYNVNQQFQVACFSYDGIEQLFHYEKFETDTSNDGINIHKTESSHIEQTLTDSLTCCVDSHFYGVVKSTDLYHLDLRQDKRISLFSNTVLGIDDWIKSIRRTKLYFEFIINQEIQIRDVHLSSKEPRPYDAAALISDELLASKTFVREIEEKPYSGTEQELLIGLSGWLKHYEKYKRVIEIWQKTIYNVNVSDEDLFVWEAQAFEAFCEIQSNIYSRAESMKAENQAFPNLKNYMLAAQEVFGFSNLDESYFKDAKDVRNYFTHNNPNHEITERQKKNSCKLIHSFLRRCIAKEFGIIHLKSSYVLIPPEI